MDYEVKSDIQDFLNSVHNKINYELIKNMSVEAVANLLIEYGVFKDKESLKNFLVVESLNAIYQEHYDYPIEVKDTDEEITDEVYGDPYALTDDIKNL